MKTSKDLEIYFGLNQKGSNLFRFKIEQLLNHLQHKESVTFTLQLLSPVVIHQR